MSRATAAECEIVAWADCRACGPQLALLRCGAVVRPRLYGPWDRFEGAQGPLNLARFLPEERAEIIDGLARQVVKPRGNWGCCGRCGTPAKLRMIRIPCASGRSLHKCSGACLGGRVSCECQCRGRCHGAGTCSCGG